MCKGVKLSKFYKIINHEVICFKVVHNDYKSIYGSFKYTYDKLDYMYTTRCNFNANNHNAQGFSAWDYANAL